MSIQSVSVIIPTYNRNSFLQKAVDSVLFQTIKCAEIVIIDDGSDDGTTEMITERYNGCNIPVRYYFQPNSGVASARNYGIECAQGDYLAFLDSDDHWHKNKIELQLEAMRKHPDFLISHTGEKWLRRGQHLNQKLKHKPCHGDIFSHCLKLCAVGMSTVMVKNELFSQVERFDSSLPCCEDYELWLRVSNKYPFLLVDLPLTIKEGGREDQLSFKHRVGMDKYRIYSLEKLIKSGNCTQEHITMAADELARKARIYGKGCVKHGKGKEGAYYIKLAEHYQIRSME